MMTANPFATLIGLVRNGKNPMYLIDQLAQTNPQYAQAQKLLRGKTPQQHKEMALNMAKEMGVDINDVLRQLGVNNASYK